MSKKISIKAILVGLVTDIGFSLIMSATIGMTAGIVAAAMGTPPDDIEAYVLNSLVLNLIMLCIGLGCTLFGGFVTAYLAKFAEIKHSLIMGMLSVISGFALMEAFPQKTPLWFNITGILLMVPAAVAGGYLRLITKKE
jgi:hypothetical protein